MGMRLWLSHEPSVRTQWSHRSMCSASSFSLPYLVEFSQPTSQSSSGSSVSKRSKVSFSVLSHLILILRRQRNNSCGRLRSNKHKWGRSLDPVLGQPQQVTRSPRLGALPNTRRTDRKGHVHPGKDSCSRYTFWLNAEHDPRSIVGTTRSRESRATIRPSRYPTSEHWYVSCTCHLHTCGILCNIRVPTSLSPPGRTNYDRSEQIILHLFPSCASRGKRVDVADDQNASRERVSQFRSKGLAPKEQVRPPFNRD